MKVLLDTCIIIDFLQRREPFFNSAYAILRHAAMEDFDGFITAKYDADIHYLTHKCTHSEEESRTKLNKLLAVVGVFDTTAEDIFHSLSSEISDFEDAIMVETGLRCVADCIVTRNTKDYLKSRLTVYTPEQLLRELGS